MKPAGPTASGMGKVEGFTQREPRDGAPASQRTEVYLGYDSRSIYVVFVCFDDQPNKIRAHLNRRENVDGEEQVGIYFDTFLDHQRAYGFRTNPLGVQQDFIWTESLGPDNSFDTVWQSRGQRTGEGYVVWMAIPFKSLRFSSKLQQTWGILLERAIPRSSEDSFWPAVTPRVDGRLSQEGTLAGLEGISAGRNTQFVPYGVFRSFRSLDTTDSANPRFTQKDAQGAVGLDAKVVVKDSLVLDATVHPDFSQVESDEPRPTANQRFAVYFPEKRPFFLENSDFFQTISTVGGMNDFYQPAIRYVFTRNIGDPQFGVRLTGKLGPYSAGFLVSDDFSIGNSLARSDPNFHKRAYFAIGRASRDIGKGSKIGVIFTDREFAGSFNRVGGFDARFKLTPSWVANLMAVVSSDLDTTGVYSYGSAYDFQLLRTGRRLTYDLEFHDASPGFITQTGFFRRPDIRRAIQNVDYTFHPEGKWLQVWGVSGIYGRSYDHSGLLLDESISPTLHLQFQGQSELGAFNGRFHETLRPVDYAALLHNLDFPENFYGGWGSIGLLRQANFHGFAYHTGAINFNPPTGQAPFAGKEDFATLGVSLRPLTALAIDNTYILDRLRVHSNGRNIFTNHILRSKWNYQITRELSLRLILQYNAVLSDPLYSSLARAKDFNADFLITYLIHPGTAFYIGYNSNLENIDRRLCLRVPLAGMCDPSTNGPLRSSGFLSDGRVLFVKLSYLFRP